MKVRFSSIPAVIIVVFMFTMTVRAQTGTPLLKIVVDEKGNKRVFDMQGNEVGPNPVQAGMGDVRKVHMSGIQDPGISTIQSQRFILSKNSNVEMAEPASPVKVQSTAQPVPVVPENAIMDSDRRNMQSIQSGGSVGPPLPVNILESENPEARLHVERKQLKKAQFDPGPNLTAVATSCNYSYSNPNLTINIRTVNNGTTSCGSGSYLGYYLSSNTIITTSDFNLGNDYVGNLPNGTYEDDTLTRNLSTILGLPAGTYYVGFIFDIYNAVSEDNEGDNAWHFTSTIYTSGGPTAPNLTKRSGYTHVFSYIAPNLTISTSVENVGSAAAGPNYLGYYLSTNNIISEADINIGQDYVSPLGVGSYSNETETINLSTVSGLTSGTYYVGYIIDHTHLITEISELDNNWHWNSPTINYQGMPNLTAQGQPCSYSFTDPNLTINVRVINDGVGSAGSSTLGYYLSSSAGVTTSDYRIGTDWVTPLSSSAYSNETISVNLQTVSAVPSLPEGTHTYYIGFIIDYLGAVAESNESDNGWYFTPSINFNRPSSGQPNLLADTGNCSYSFTGGNELTVFVRTINNGAVSSGPSNLAYYLSEDDVIGTGDYRISEDYQHIIAVGAHENDSCRVNLQTVDAKPDLPDGTHTYYVGFLLDYLNEVAESNENDNSYYFGATVSFTRGATHVEEEETIPIRFELCQNYPNPFNPNTTIRYSIPKSGMVSVRVYNLQGQKVKTIIHEFQQAGNYSYDFKAEGLSSGIYYYQLKVDGKIYDMKKMILAR
jgi:hypothetical protein